MQAIKFKASFPPIQGAIKRHGGGDGLRIQLDIPESEMGEAVKLLALGQLVLEVTVEVESKRGQIPEAQDAGE